MLDEIEEFITGDGFVATFISPSATIACADAIVDAVHLLGIEVRVGIHAGEIEVRVP
jgi:class 3 adenylate cyclase